MPFTLSVLLIGGLGAMLWADPFENVTSDQRLYQRVKQLGDYGLLDDQDKKVLDDGKVVTKMELAFYVEKAKARIEAPRPLPTAVPVIAVPTAVVPSLPPPVMDTPTPSVSAPAVLPPVVAPPQLAPTETPVPPMALPTPIPAAPALPPAMDKSALQKEIMDLLRELRQESAALRTKMAQDDYRVKQQADELERLKAVQDDVESAFKKANKSSGSPNFNTETNIRYENISTSGITVVNFTKATESVNLGMWSDLGGKGAISLGISAYVPLSNASDESAPVSLSLFSPKINWGMDGKLGHWDATVAVEAYTSDVDLGDFTRGNPLNATRFEDPFDIKKYSEDKNSKNWDDFMNNLGYVPSVSSYISQSNTGIVFDGVYLMGSNLPLVSKDAKATLLFGRMGRDKAYLPEIHRLEEGAKYSQPWLNGFLQTSFSTYWVNEDLGFNATNLPTMDLKNYEVDMGFDFKPFFLGLKYGLSHFYTGFETGNPNPVPLEAAAGQASLSLYPLTFYYNAIGDNYSNIQSTAFLAGFNLSHYGYNGGSYSATTDYYYGFVGMVDDLISDRNGWRVNLGWKGRQESWTKFLPSFFDDMILNMDVAQNKEYRMILDDSGHNVIQTYNLITVYYPDDTGLWGSDIWGGYSGLHPLGTAYTNNVLGIRNETVSEPLLAIGNGYSTIVPFMLPVYSSPGVIQTSGGHNVFTTLDHLKTFQYITLTTKFQLNKMLGMSEPFYGSFFLTDHNISGKTGGTLGAMPDPNRPGKTLADVPSLFDQRVYDTSLFYQLVKDVDLMADYGLETWKSDYTYPPISWRTDSFGGGFAYDTPWGGGKFELRYKHLISHDITVPLNSFTADQFYAYFLMKF